MNPSDRWCWRTCGSCYRCGDKGTRALCTSCSGRHDPQFRRDPYDIDDQCRCTEGILQIRVKSGRLIRRRFATNPFAGSVKVDQETKDERDWGTWIREKREQLDDPTFDPVTFADGSSTFDWMQKARTGV